MVISIPFFEQIRVSITTLLICCVLLPISSVFSQEDPIQIRNISSAGPPTQTIINNNITPDYGYVKYEARASDDSKIGRSPYEVINIDLRLKRPLWDIGNKHKSLPSDVPFYIDGKINKGVKKVYVVIVEKIKRKNKKSAEEVEAIVQSFLNSDSSLTQTVIEEKVIPKIRDSLKKKRIMIFDKLILDKFPEVEIASWEKPQDHVNYEEETKTYNEFSVLIPGLSAGARFNIFFFFEIAPEKTKKDEIASKLTKVYIDSLENVLNLYNSPLIRYEQDTTWGENKVYDFTSESAIEELRKLGFGKNIIVSNYKVSADSYSNDLTAPIEEYIQQTEGFKGKNNQIIDSSDEIRKSLFEINCDFIKSRLIEFLHPKLNDNVFLGEISVDINNRKPVKQKDFETRTKNIKEFLKYLNNIVDEACVLKKCCEDEEFISIISKVQILTLQSLENYQNVIEFKDAFSGKVLEVEKKSLTNFVSSVSPIGIPLNSNPSFISRAEAAIIPDLGFVYQFSNKYPNQVLPYYGVNFNFKHINRQNPYCILDIFLDIYYKGWSKGFLRNERLFEPFSLSLGMTFGNNFSDDRRESFIPGLNSSALIGLGTRLNDYLRFNAGYAVYKEVDNNLIRNRTKYERDLYISLSLDLDIEQFLGNTIGRIF